MNAGETAARRAQVERWFFPVLVGLWLLGVVVWTHADLWQKPGLLGAAQTDVVRGVWGLQHQAGSVPGIPFWTEFSGFPEGVKIVILPMLSSVMGVPLLWIFGPLNGYSLWVLLLLWAAGLAAAVLARAVTGQTSAGFVAGTAMVAQPMMFLALTDGTPENVAFWALPLTLAVLWRAREEVRPSLGLLAGVLGTAVAFDSPYHAVFLLPFLLIVVPFTPWRVLLAELGAGVVGGILLLILYYGIPLKAPTASLEGNALHLSVWRQYELQSVPDRWDYTLSASFIPVAFLLAAGALSVLRPVRATPWLLVGLLALALGLGPGRGENPGVLGEVLGARGRQVGEWIASFNEQYPVPVVRFPRRWVLPAALAFAIAAELGLSRFPLRWLRGVLGLGLAVGMVWQVDRLVWYRRDLPVLDPPQPEFAKFVREHELDGAIIILPTSRAALRPHGRHELPVFANIGSSITSGADSWVHALCGRPAVNRPTGLVTMVPRRTPNPEFDKIVRDLDDLTLPQTVSREIPPSATQEPARRAGVARQLVELGLRFLVIDEQIYGEEGLKMVKLPFDGMILEDRHFDDGTGATVVVLGE